ncbi:MAG: molybdopterin-dependent oxidoreductase, partial [Acidobacteria bacterium]|nr:molybdopterin-dependent oxidoreductase [Acidobacteriota bacterium]
MPEIERYELASGPAYRFELDRREFFRVVGGGIVLLVTLEDAGAQESGGGRRRGGRFEAAPKAIGAWLHIGEDGRITVYSGKAEVGQNVRTSVTLAAAEELGVRPEAVRTVLGDTALTPFDAGTFGSRSTPVMFPQIRRAAAALREVLIGLAAERWKCDRGDVQVTDGKLRNRSGAELSFAELTRGRKILETISDATPLKPASEWTVAGRPLTKVNGRDFVTGRHRFASDVIRPGMLHGKVVRPAAFGATAASADIAAAGRIPGATVVHDRGFIAAAAADEETLGRAAETVRVEWSAEPQPSSRELYDYLRRNASPARGGTERGSIEDALKAAEVKLESTYTVAYIAHTPLEPRAAVAEWEGGKLTVWTGTQRPFGVRGELAQAFGIAESDVHVIVPDTGSGYGGKHTGECAIEAARLARAAGKPVKLVWTREEEFTWAYARPAGVIDVRSGARRDGTLTAWEFHNYNSGGSAIQTLYDAPNQRIQFHA